MRTPGIELRRYPYEEPYNIRLVISPTNGGFTGFLNYYCAAKDLRDIGNALKNFPRQVPDEYVYELGSTRPEDRSAYYLLLRAYTIDRIGHCALQIIIDNNEDAPNEGSCRFSIKAEPASINTLGDYLLTFAELRHVALSWNSSGACQLDEPSNNEDVGDMEQA